MWGPSGLTVGICGAIAASSLALAPTANADEMSFLQGLNNRGIYVYNAALAIASGYQICNHLDANGGDGVETVNWAYWTSPYSYVPTRTVAYMWVQAAVGNLCPWHGLSV
jgi:Protein of unknown function (DUF732)